VHARLGAKRNKIHAAVQPQCAATASSGANLRKPCLTAWPAQVTFIDLPATSSHRGAQRGTSVTLPNLAIYRSRRGRRRRWPASAAGSASEGPPGARRATLADTADLTGSPVTQIGSAHSRLPGAPLSRSRPPCLGHPSGGACDSASPKPRHSSWSQGIGACRGAGRGLNPGQRQVG
jgi:hypothetical protein